MIRNYKKEMMIMDETNEGNGLFIVTKGAMTIMTTRGFGTLSGSLIALPAVDHPERRPVWRFVQGRPGEAPWQNVDMRLSLNVAAERATPR